MGDHTPYFSKFKHQADFRVKYRFYTDEEGGRKSIPCQGYRSDFWYVHPDYSSVTTIFMIWPEFEDSAGEVILLKDIPVPPEGTARMWMINEQMRGFHRVGIQVGTIGYFTEGSRKVAECVVVDISGLNLLPVVPWEVNGKIYG